MKLSNFSHSKVAKKYCLFFHQIRVKGNNFWNELKLDESSFLKSFNEVWRLIFGSFHFCNLLLSLRQNFVWKNLEKNLFIFLFFVLLKYSVFYSIKPGTKYAKALFSKLQNEAHRLTFWNERLCESFKYFNEVWAGTFLFFYYFHCVKTLSGKIKKKLIIFFCSL